MKKLISVFVACLIFVVAYPQKEAAPGGCDCNPHGFNPFVYNYLGASTTVRAGHQFSVKCGSPVKLDGGYKCVGDCAVKFSATLKNAAGTVVENYPEFKFPFEYTFPSAGSYSLEITPVCGEKKCTPAKFYFTVNCATTADCACGRWDGFKSYIDNDSKAVKCGASFTLKLAQQFKLEGGYSCKGDCKAKFSAVLTDIASGSEVESFADFQFAWAYKFPKPGKYKLTIVPVCSDVKCTPCVFYFAIF